MSRSPRLVTAVALSATLLLAGCGGDGSSTYSPGSSSQSDDKKSGDDEADTKSDDETEALDVDGATGPELSTDDFSFNAPEGWEQNDQAAPGALVFAADPKDSDGFADNVNVIEDPTLARANDNGDIEDGVETSLKSANATDIELHDPVALDGTEAVVVSSIFSLNNVEYAVRQYAVKRDDTGYIVTFSYSKDLPEDEQVDLAESVISTWSWAS